MSRTSPRLLTARSSLRNDRESIRAGRGTPDKGLLPHALALCLSGVLLAGCSGGEGADPAPSSGNGSSTASLEPLPSDTTTSEDAEQDPSYSIPPRPEVEPPQEPVLTGDEATDAVNLGSYFMLMYPYILKTADASSWVAITSPECSRCFEVIENAESDRATGTWVDGELQLIDYQLFKSTDDDSDYQIAFLVERTGVVAYKTDGATDIEDGTFTVILSVTSSDGWEVSDLQIANPSEFGDLGS